MKYLNFFFHIYQPPTQSASILSEIVEQSYRPLTETILEFEDLKFTMNINYCLVELLVEHGFTDVIDNIRRAYERGTLELTATAAYHTILPLLPHEEALRQLRTNDEGNRHLLSPSFEPTGIFCPEMAFTGDLVPLFRSRDYRWTIVDDHNLKHFVEKIPYDQVFTFDGLMVFLRSNWWTNRFADYQGQWRGGKDAVVEIRQGLTGWMGTNDGYLIIALDGETFGHHQARFDRRFLREFFEALAKNHRSVKLSHLNEIGSIFPQKPAFIPPGSWSTDEEAMLRRDYFSWWRSPKNEIHRRQWEFTDFVLEQVRLLSGNPEINAEMDKALYSCQYWWASFWKFNPGEIYRGAFNMMQVLQRIADLPGGDYARIEQGERLFRDLVIAVEKENHFRMQRAQ